MSEPRPVSGGGLPFSHGGDRGTWEQAVLTLRLEPGASGLTLRGLVYAGAVGSTVTAGMWGAWVAWALVGAYRAGRLSRD